MLCWQYRSSGGAKSASVKICMWIVGTIILTIGVAWCTPGHAIGDSIAAVGSTSYAASAGWYFMGSVRGRVDAVRRHRQAQSSLMSHQPLLLSGVEYPPKRHRHGYSGAGPLRAQTSSYPGG
jgi:hypothetical protein